jgi:hypothetical protein
VAVEDPVAEVVQEEVALVVPDLITQAQPVVRVELEQVQPLPEVQ